MSADESALLANAAIHVGVTEDVATSLEAYAFAEGWCVIRIDVSEVVDYDSLMQLLHEEFLFPTKTDLDGAVSYISDLWWLSEFDGYVYSIRGLDTLFNNAESEFRELISMLPNIVDRWRTGVPFNALVVATGATADAAMRVIRTENEATEDYWRRATYENVGDVQPAPVVDHRVK